jgi:DNA-directed RNA polymerase specialized sigma24 family protein
VSDFDPSVYWKLIVKAARTVAQSYYLFEPEDIAQAIMLDMLESPRRYANIGGPLLFKVLQRAGYRYCQDQASRLLLHADQYTYSAEEIKQLLGRFYDPANWPNGWSQPQAGDFDDELSFSSGLDVWAENTRICIEHLDLANAVGKLRPSHRDVIEKRYRDGQALSRSEARNAGHAIRLITYYVNEGANRGVPWDHEGPGARTAVSNTAAARLTGDSF